MFKLHIVVAFACFLACVAVAENRERDAETIQYIWRFLNFPFTLVQSEPQSHDVDASGLPSNGGTLSFLERLLLFPAFMTQTHGLCKKRFEDLEFGSWEEVQMCSGSDLLEYMSEEVQDILSALKSTLLSMCSLYDWQAISAPLNYIHAAISTPDISSTIWKMFESLVCLGRIPRAVADDPDGATVHDQLCRSVTHLYENGGFWSHVQLLITWSLFRYLVAGVLALSLLGSVCKTVYMNTGLVIQRVLRLYDDAKVKLPVIITKLVYCTSSTNKENSNQAGHYPMCEYFDTELCSNGGKLSPKLRHYQMCQFFDALPCNCGGMSESKQVPPKMGHYKMCEFFDLLPCNCGGKPVLKQDSLRVEHYKMCEFFDSLPCNCGGIINSSTEEIESLHADAKHAISIPEDDSQNYVKSSLSSDAQNTQDPSVQAFTESVSRDYSEKRKMETNQNEAKAIEYEKLIQMIEEAVDRYLKRTYPTMQFFEGEAKVPMVSSYAKNNKQIEVPGELSGIKGHISSESFQDAEVEVRAAQQDIVKPEGIENIQRAHTLVMGKIPINNGRDENGLQEATQSLDSGEIPHRFSPVEKIKDIEVSFMESQIHVPCGKDTAQVGNIEVVNQCSNNIKELIQCYAEKLRSTPHRSWNESVGSLKLDTEFISELNGILSAGYDSRYYYANHMMGHSVPFFTALKSNHSGKKDGVCDNKQPIEINRSGSSPVHFLIGNTEADTKKSVQFVDNLDEKPECDPAVEYDDINLSDFVDCKTEPEENQPESCQLTYSFINTESNNDIQQIVSEDYFDISPKEEGHEESEFSYESGPEYLSDASRDEYLNISQDIGSPRHNSSFKDNSPYTRTNLVAPTDLRAGGDGAVYSTVTRRSPFAELGLSDLSLNMSIEPSEKSILDVSDINDSISFNRDTGLLEIAAIFVVRTMWRLAKQMWEQKTTDDMQNCLTVEEKENGLFFIRQTSQDTNCNFQTDLGTNCAVETDDRFKTQENPGEKCPLNTEETFDIYESSKDNFDEYNVGHAVIEDRQNDNEQINIKERQSDNVDVYTDESIGIQESLADDIAVNTDEVVSTQESPRDDIAESREESVSLQESRQDNLALNAEDSVRIQDSPRDILAVPTEDTVSVQESPQNYIDINTEDNVDIQESPKGVHNVYTEENVEIQENLNKSNDLHIEENGKLKGLAESALSHTGGQQKDLSENNLTTYSSLDGPLTSAEVNDNNNARFHRFRRERRLYLSSSDDQSANRAFEVSNCSTYYKACKVHKRKKKATNHSSPKYRRCDENSRKPIREITKASSIIPKETKKGRKRSIPTRDLSSKSKFKLIKVKRASHKNKRMTQNPDGDGSCSEGSGNIADQSSSSSNEDSDTNIRSLTVEWCTGFDIDSADEEQCLLELTNPKPKHKQVYTDELEVYTEKQMGEILKQLQSLGCNAWELKDFKHLQINDNASKCLAWAWSCAEK